MPMSRVRKLIGLLLVAFAGLVGWHVSAKQPPTVWDDANIAAQIAWFDEIKSNLLDEESSKYEVSKNSGALLYYDSEYSKRAGWVDIFRCYPPYYTGDDPYEREYFYKRLAEQSIFVARRLEEAGYKPDVYKNPIRDYEIRNIYRSYRIVTPIVKFDSDYGLIRDDDQEFFILTTRIEKNRRLIQPDSLPIVAIGECGDGDVPYIFTTDPPNGSLWIIPEFDALICKRRGIDPWSKRRCFGWFEADGEVYLSGRYLFTAQWPDGSVRKGIRLFEADAVTSEAMTIVIRKQ